MSDKDYRIILPLTLDGISKYGDIYDVTMCNDDNAKTLKISGYDFDKMNIEDICLDLYKKYKFLLGDGDYYFLHYNDCIILKKYLVDSINIKEQLSLELYDSLISFCDEAIMLKTGLGFDF